VKVIDLLGVVHVLHTVLFNELAILSLGRNRGVRQQAPVGEERQLEEEAPGQLRIEDKMP